VYFFLLEFKTDAMKKVTLILRILGAVAMLLFLILFIAGYTNYATVFIVTAIFCIVTAVALNLSQLYHNYFVNRRRS